MKIGFIGNMNNYPFTLALALRKMGVDVRFLVDSNQALCRPEHRFGAHTVGYDDWMFDLAPMRTWDAVLPTPKRKLAISLLEGCDAIVANGWGIAFSVLLGKPTFVISTGSDLDMLANDEYLRQIEDEGRGSLSRKFRSLSKRWLYRRLIPRQRLGFRRAIGVEYAWPGVLPHGDKLFEEIGVPVGRRHSFMLTDIERLRFEPPPMNDVLRILGVARLNWCEPLPPGFSILDNKRTDLLLQGVAIYLRGKGSVELRLFRKGLHVQETEALVARLGLAKHVTWLDEMPQSAFVEQIIQADVVADHFGEGTIGIGARDALAVGRPVLAGGDPACFEVYAGEPLPIVNAKTPEEVAAALDVLTAPEVRQRYAIRGRAFAERNFSISNAANNLLRVLESA